MSRNRRIVLAAALLAAVSGGLFVAFGRTPEDSTTRYETAEAGTGAIERVVAATGAIRPIVTVEIGSQLSGQIAELHADFNDEVKAGDLVARIDPSTFRARLAQSEADLKLARAGLKAAEAGMIRARLEITQAERDYARNKTLAEQGNLSTSALDNALTALEIARANLMTAESQKTTAEATVEQREAQLEQARIDLERTEIRSPIDGVIVNRSVDVGQTVAASLSAPVLFEIAQDLRAIQIEASVDESDIGSVREGNPVRFTVDAYEGRQFEGEVHQVRLAPVELQNVVTYTVIILARNDDMILLPGMTANLEIITGRRENVVRIPNEALRFRPASADAAASASAGRSGGAGGGGFGPQLATELGLDDAQQARLREAFAAMRAGFAAGGGPGGDAGGDPEAARAAFRQRLEKMLGDILTEEQMARWRALQRERASVRRAIVWTVGPDGAPQAAPVTLGLSDNRHSEILTGLAPGTPVILRARREAQG